MNGMKKKIKRIKRNITFLFQWLKRRFLTLTVSLRKMSAIVPKRSVITVSATWMAAS